MQRVGTKKPSKRLGSCRSAIELRPQHLKDQALSKSDFSNLADVWLTPSPLVAMMLHEPSKTRQARAAVEASGMTVTVYVEGVSDLAFPDNSAETLCRVQPERGLFAPARASDLLG